VRALAFAAVLLMLALPAGRARADEAAVYQQKATAAFALGEYKEAAENFERAFKLHPDPALLYNAAQAHRLGGNKERALTLYENYLRVYGKKNSRAEEVQRHIDDLKAAIGHDKSVATSPPPAAAAVAAEPVKAPPPAPAPAIRTTAAPTPVAPKPAAPAAPPPAAPAPAPATAPPPIVTTAPPPTASAAPVLVAQPAAQPADRESVARKPWFWIVVGGVVAAAAVATLVLVSAGSTKDPTPSLGAVNGYPP
jgi:tetratricopeptide (TPR) repeat protein